MGFLKTFRRVVALVAMTFLFFSGEAQVNVKRKTLPEKRFEGKMQKKIAMVLHVRTMGEVQAGHLPGALNMDVQKDDFNQNIQLLDKNKTYLFINE